MEKLITTIVTLMGFSTPFANATHLVQKNSYQQPVEINWSSAKKLFRNFPPEQQKVLISIILDLEKGLIENQQQTINELKLQIPEMDDVILNGPRQPIPTDITS